MGDGDESTTEDSQLNQLIRPESWTIVSVRGREVADREPGLPRLSEITLADEAGESRTFRARQQPREDDSGTGVASPIACAPVVPIRVSRCLICLGTDGPWTDEHLSPKNFGGSGLLATCARCNNDLGSLEGALLEWYDQRRSWRLHIPEQRQPISAGWVTVLTSDDGETLMINDETWAADAARDAVAEHAERGKPFIPEDAPPRPAAYLTQRSSRRTSPGASCWAVSRLSRRLRRSAPSLSRPGMRASARRCSDPERPRWAYARSRRRKRSHRSPSTKASEMGARTS